MTNNPTTAEFIAMYSIEYLEEYDKFMITYDGDKNLSWIEEHDDDNYNYEYKIKMDDDYGREIHKKSNMMWIEDIKKHYNWKVGDVIYLNAKQNCDGCFYIMRGWRDDDDSPRVEDKRCYCCAIDSDGYVVKRTWRYYTAKASSLIPDRDYIFRINCAYNDYVRG
jgi:hypothetical protein